MPPFNSGDPLTPIKRVKRKTSTIFSIRNALLHKFPKRNSNETGTHTNVDTARSPNTNKNKGKLK